MAGCLLARRSLLADAELSAEQLGRADGYDPGANSWALQKDRLVLFDQVDLDVLPQVGQGRGARERPGVAGLVVEHRRVGNDLPGGCAGAHLGGLDAETLRPSATTSSISAAALHR